MKQSVVSAAALSVVATLAILIFTGVDAAAQTTWVVIHPQSGPPGQLVTVQMDYEFGVHWNDPSCRGNTELGYGVGVVEFSVPAGTVPGTYPLYGWVDVLSPHCFFIGYFNVTLVPTPVQPTPVPTPVQPTPVQPTPVQPTPVQNDECKEANALKIPSTKKSDTLVVLVHGWNSEPSMWDDLVAAYEKKKANADVVTLDWAAAAAGSNPKTGGFLVSLNPGTGYAWTGPKLDEALRVGPCLGDRLKASGYSSFHLISHSLGAWVIDAAADQLASDPSKRVHLTFLDAYVPKGESNGKLGDRALFAEQYVSTLLGKPTQTAETLGEAYNWDVTNPALLSPSVARAWATLSTFPQPNTLAGKLLTDQVAGVFFEEHAWPIQRYTTRVLDSEALGWEWGRPPSHQELKEGQVACLRTFADCIIELPKMSARELDLSKLNVSKLLNAKVGDGAIDFETHSPASASFTLDERASAMSFDLSASVVGAGRGKLTFRVNGTDEFVTDFGPEGLKGGVLLLLANETAVTSLEITFDTVGQGQVTAQLKGARVVSVEGQQTSGRGSSVVPTVQLTPRPPATGNGGIADSGSSQNVMASGGALLVALFVALLGTAVTTRRRASASE